MSLGERRWVTGQNKRHFYIFDIIHTSTIFFNSINKIKIKKKKKHLKFNLSFFLNSLFHFSFHESQSKYIA